jgi:6-phosphogluconolactonase
MLQFCRLCLLLLCCAPVSAQRQPILLVGTYTNGASKGIYVYRFNSATGTAALASTAATSNPSYLAVSSNQRYVYAVNEDADSTVPYGGGSVTAFAFDRRTDSLTALGQQPSGGRHPCYISASNNGRWVIVGNYSTGTVAVLPILKGGGLGALVQRQEHTGGGPNLARQRSAHVHGTVLTSSNKHLLVPDLGVDVVFAYPFDAATGQLGPAVYPMVATAPGSGPRHIVLNQANNRAYLTEELTGNVTVFSLRKGALARLQTLSAHPVGYTGPISSADIHLSPDGRFLYCSNRGASNTIAIFAVNKKTGLLTAVGHQPTLGETPRNFSFDPSGQFLLVANQQSSNIVIFKVNKQTGLLTDTGQRIEVPNPVCLKWITGGKKVK